MQWYTKIGLALAFVIVPLLPGYHPAGEWDQGPAICARDLIGIEGGLAWEFYPENALRSILAQYLATGPAIILSRILFLATRFIPVLDHIQQGAWIYICVRYWTAGCSLVSFYLFKRAVEAQMTPASAAAVLWTYATSHVTWMYGVRAFSNAMEVNLAMGAIYVVFGEKRTMYHQPMKLSRSIALGINTAFGVFTRPTFVVYAAPIGFAYLWEGYHSVALNQRNQRNIVVKHTLIGGTTFALASSVFIISDTLYFGGTLPWHLVISPWNHMRYNLYGDVVERFGGSPRWMSSTVNMSLIAGPLWWLSIIAICRAMWRGRTTAGDTSATAYPYSPLPVYSAGPVKSGFPNLDNYLLARSHKLDDTCVLFRRTMLAIVVLPLITLSTPGHAEPRFLLPIFIGLVIWSPATSWIYNSRGLKSAWLLFNFGGLVFFGILHRSGMTMAPLLLEHSTKSPDGMVRQLIESGAVPPIAISSWEFGQMRIDVLNGLPTGDVLRPISLPPLADLLNIDSAILGSSYYFPALDPSGTLQDTRLMQDAPQSFLLLEEVFSPLHLAALTSRPHPSLNSTSTLEIIELARVCGTLKVPYPVRLHKNLKYWYDAAMEMRRGGGWGWEVGCMALYLVQEGEAKTLTEVEEDLAYRARIWDHRTRRPGAETTATQGPAARMSSTKTKRLRDVIGGALLSMIGVPTTYKRLDESGVESDVRVTVLPNWARYE